MLNQLVEMLEKIKDDANGLPFTLVFLGDYVDRGPQSCQVINTLIALRDRRYPPYEGVDYEPVFLKGNHEDLMLDAIAERDPMGNWVMNGGLQTVESYPKNSDGVVLVPDSHRQFLKMDLQLYYEDDKTFFCHAGINADRPLNNQLEKDLLWIREYFLKRTHKFEKLIVHGHSPWQYDTTFVRDKMKPYRVNLDAGCCFEGTLVAGVFRNDREFADDYRLLRVDGLAAPKYLERGGWR